MSMAWPVWSGGLRSKHLREILSYIQRHGYTITDADRAGDSEPDPDNRVRSTTNSERVGVEAGPVVAKSLTAALAAAESHGPLPALDVSGLLPTSGPSGTVAVGPLPVYQTVTVGNAAAAFALEYRTNREDATATKAVAMVIRTSDVAYQHDYAICPRFHGNVLEATHAFRVTLPVSGKPAEESAWFWFSRLSGQLSGDDRSNVEEGCQFLVFVDETRRTLSLDSRWIDKQYSPHWRYRARMPYDYVLNFQVWASNAEETLKLVHAILRKLACVPGSWRMTYENREEPTQPTVFVERARLADNGIVSLSVWSDSPSSCLACFHGTKRQELAGRDEYFQSWLPVHPGRNRLLLTLGQVHNAVIHCEARIHGQGVRQCRSTGT